VNNKPLPQDVANVASSILKFLEKSEREFIEKQMKQDEVRRKKRKEEDKNVNSKGDMTE
jgi:hypothetical protein